MQLYYWLTEASTESDDLGHTSAVQLTNINPSSTVIYGSRHLIHSCVYSSSWSVRRMWKHVEYASTSLGYSGKPYFHI